MKRTILAAALAVAAISVQAQSLVFTHRVELGYQCNDATSTCSILRATTEDGRFTVTELDEHGSLVFHTAASTVDFAPQGTVDTSQVGTLAGFVIVRIGGQPYAMPVYNLKP